MRQTAERLGIGWIYWEFGTDFGAYDPAAGAWREPLREALLGPDRGAAPMVGSAVSSRAREIGCREGRG